MELRIVKKGFSYSQDGPGNRLVYHLQGCNMDCRWCANPESIPRDGVLMVSPDKLLDAVCPHGAIQEQQLERARCNECKSYSCVREHKNEGIKWSCFAMKEEALLKEVQESRSLFFDSGGVTFSGGEPTVQYEALKQVLQKLNEKKIHTVIETNGTHVRLEELFPYTDMLIMDFKHIDGNMHEAFTGVSNEQIKRNIKKAMEEHQNVLIRTPLIQGFNTDEDFIQQYISFYQQFPLEHVQFEFLKFHEYGKDKWQKIGRTYQMNEGYVTDEKREQFEKAYKENGLRIVRT